MLIAAVRVHERPPVPATAKLEFAVKDRPNTPAPDIFHKFREFTVRLVSCAATPCTLIARTGSRFGRGLVKSERECERRVSSDVTTDESVLRRDREGETTACLNKNRTNQKFLVNS